MVTDHRRPFAALGPVAAGHVLVGRRSTAFRGRPGKHVMLVADESHSGNPPAVLGQAGLAVDPAGRRMQVVDILRDLDAKGVHPGTLADPVARVDRLGAADGLDAEIGTPGLATGAGPSG